MSRRDPHSAQVYERQNAIQGWNHEVIERQNVLLLGLGGIGCAAAMALCRLGVRSVIIVDIGTVEAHHLNRQSTKLLSTNCLTIVYDLVVP